MKPATATADPGVSDTLADVKRDDVISLRLTSEELAVWNVAAESEGRTLSEWIRFQGNAAAKGKQIIGTDREDEMLALAIKSHLRFPGAAQPASSSAIEIHEGHHYAVLRSARGVLACYLVGGDERVQRLAAEEWPEGVIGEDSAGGAKRAKPRKARR